MKAVLLTKSDKDGGFCITGMRPDNGQFIRLISNSDGTALPKWMFDDIQRLDVIEFDESLLVHVPIGPQTENHLVFLPSLTKSGHFDGSFQEIYEASSKFLSGKACYMEQAGKCFADASIYDHSLEIIRVDDFSIYKGYKGKNKARFHYHGTLYRDISFTDYSVAVPKDEPLVVGKAYLIITIPNHSYVQDGVDRGYYKFVAAYYPCEEEPVMAPEETEPEETVSTAFSYAPLFQMLDKFGLTLADLRKHKLFSPTVIERIQKGYAISIDSVAKLCIGLGCEIQDVFSVDYTYSMETESKSQYKPWSEDEELLLIGELKQGLSVAEIAIHHGRTTGAINSRIEKLVDSGRYYINRSAGI